MSTLVHLSGCRIVLHALDHDPPHFHAVSANGEELIIGLQDLTPLQGQLRSGLLMEVLTWAEQHRGELLQAWRELQR